MKKVFLSLITIFMVLSLSVVLIKADGETTVSLVDGVKIRTDGNNGLQWVANVTNHKDSNEYGFLFAQGDLVEVTVATPNVVKQVAEGVTEEETVMKATMTKFPKAAATQDISVVAYAKDGENYIYSNVVVRNLAEVAVYAKNSVDGDFVNAVAQYVGENYKKTFQDANNVLYYDNALYETNHLALAEEFIKDWNAKFGTELDAKTAFVAVEYDSPFRKSARSSGTDATTSGLYKFFNDEKMSVKWGWLLDYILEELKSGVGYDPCKYQIEVIRGAENTNTSDWYYGFNTVSYIQSIFNAKGTSAGSGQFRFENSPEKLALISEYNNQVYTNGLYSKFIAKECEIQLPAIVEKTGYTSKWMLGEDSYEGNASFILDAETNFAFVQKHTPVTYNITFFNGEEELTTKAATYTIENELVLPTLEIEGYAFLGWCESSNLDDAPITTIAKGTVGNKVFYAKLSEAYTVTYNLNGGTIRYATFAEMSADFVADFNATTGKTATADTLYNAGNVYGTFFDNPRMFAKWSWTLELFLELAEANYGNNSEAVEQYETFLAGEGSTVASQWAVRQNMQGLMTLTKAAKYSSAAAIDFSLAEVQVYIFGAINAGVETEKYVSESAVIENVYRTGYTFAGWYDNAGCEGEAVTTVTEETTLYAKWDLIKYTVTYVLNNNDATVEKEDDEVSALDYYVLATPSYDVAKWQFLGWFTDEECTNPISHIAEFNENDITVYASWDVVTGFQVTYNFNGGNTKYADKEAVVSDLLADINAHFGKSYTKTSFPSSKWGSNISFNEMFNSTLSYKAKWQWLLDFLYTTETNSGNKTAIGKLSGAVSSSWSSSTDPYGATYVFYAFINSKCQNVHSSYVTIDYSLDENNQFWDELSATEVTVYNNTTEIVNNVYKYGYTFGGWYTTEDFQEGTQVTTITANCTLYAKWVEAAE